MPIIFQVLILIATLILGALLGAWLTAYLRQPELRVVGAGGGGGPTAGTYVTSLRIGNVPGLMGIRLGETAIFGKYLHGAISWGVTLERGPARECTAFVYERKSHWYNRRRRHGAMHLWWRSPANPDEAVPNVTLRSGDQCDLFVFARLLDQPGKYFFFQPDGKSLTPKIPADDSRISDEAEFEIMVQDSYGRHRTKLGIAVRKEFDGRLRWETPGGSGSF